jgi:hypothetical protein
LVQSELVTFPRHIRHLEISEARYLDNMPEHGIGYFQSLTKLCIVDSRFDSFNDLANFLLACPILEDLSLDEISWPHISESVPVTGSLPSLRHLAIRFVSEDVIAWLLSLQPVPALQSFAFYSRSQRENLLRVNTLLQTLGPSLRRLGIDGALSHSCMMLTI